jgi:hypothetical protein
MTYGMVLKYYKNCEIVVSKPIEITVPRYSLPLDKGVGYIISGKEKGSLRALHLNTTENRK